MSSRIAFERDKFTLERGGDAALDELATLLRANPRVVVTIVVHTDDRRPPAEAQVITDNQAETVRAYLLGKGVSPDQIEAFGRGSTAPLPGVTGDQNRRVELDFRPYP